MSDDLDAERRLADGPGIAPRIVGHFGNAETIARRLLWEHNRVLTDTTVLSARRRGVANAR